MTTMLDGEPTILAYRFHRVSAARATVRELDGLTSTWQTGEDPLLITFYATMWPAQPNGTGGYEGPAWALIISHEPLTALRGAALCAICERHGGTAATLPEDVTAPLVRRSAARLLPLVLAGPRGSRRDAHPLSGPGMVAFPTISGEEAL